MPASGEFRCDEIEETDMNAQFLATNANHALTNDEEIVQSDQLVCCDNSNEKTIEINDEFNVTQLSTIIEALSMECLHQNSEIAKRNLRSIHNELAKLVSFGHVQLLGKVQAVLNLLDGHCAEAQGIIKFGFYDRVHHEFLRTIYKEAERRLTGKHFGVGLFDFFDYPSSIDPKDDKNVPESLANALRNYYEKKRQEKKALKIEKAAENTGLHINIVTELFKEFRDENARANAPKTVAKRCANYRCIVGKENSERLLCTPDADLFPLFAMSSTGIPFAGVPFNQQLSIEVENEDDSCYFSIVPCLQIHDHLTRDCCKENAMS